MKYLIFNAGGIESVRIFDEITDHSAVVREVDLPVVSAGRLSFQVEDNNNPVCFCAVSGSVTLKIPFSKEQSHKDFQLIKRFLAFRV